MGSEMCIRDSSRDVEELLTEHEIIFVVDQNRDGQFRSLLVNETGIEKSKLRSVRHYSGPPLSAVHVLKEVLPVLDPHVDDTAAAPLSAHPADLLGSRV